MAINITWATKTINVPQADLTLVSGNIYELDLNSFRKILNNLQDDVEGMPFETTHNHTPPLQVGGLALARVVEIINGYTVTFEDLQYAVNLIGANTNLQDVANVNQVSIRSGNTAGLVDNFKIDEIWKVHGMDPTKQLIITSISRDAGSDISQTITDSAGTVTVKRN